MIEGEIRNQRTLQGVSLRSLASKLGISPSQLSKIETGKSKLSVDLALQIAAILEVPAAVFLSKGRRHAAGRRTISRVGTSKIHKTHGMSFEPLCTDFEDHDMLYWKVIISASSFEEIGGWRKHPGQEFFFVLTGKVRLLSELYKPVELSAGDSILFDSDQSHAYIAVGGPATVLMTNNLT